MRTRSRHVIVPGRFGLTLAAISVMICLAPTAMSSSQHRISQRGRAFQPGQISIRRGEAIQIVNDDGDLLHHAYLSSERFSFDIGDQEPGASADVTFPEPGRFTVLCGIHPKMKLLVHVE